MGEDDGNKNRRGKVLLSGFGRRGDTLQGSEKGRCGTHRKTTTYIYVSMIVSHSSLDVSCAFVIVSFTSLKERVIDRNGK